MDGATRGRRFIRAVLVAEQWATRNPTIGRYHVTKFLDEAEADGGIPLFVRGVLRANETAAARVFTPFGRVALDVALIECARIDGDQMRRIAAELILGFAALQDHSDVDTELRAIGADALGPLADVIDEVDCWRRVAEAVVSVWAELMPAVYASDEGLAALDFD